MSFTNPQANDQEATASPSQHPASGSEHAVEPSGPKGDNPATAGPGPTKVKSGTPENRSRHINPSAPEDSNTTPGTTHENRGRSFGRVIPSRLQYLQALVEAISGADANDLGAESVGRKA